GAVGPKVLQGDGHTESTILPYPSLGHTIWNTLGMYKPDLEQRKSVDSLAGCCVLVRSEALEQVGLLDENYFIYAEETEWFYRMRKNDWSVVYLPIPSIIHKGASSSRRIENKTIYVERRANVIYTLVKHKQLTQAFLTAVFMIVLLSFRALFSVIRGGQDPGQQIQMGMLGDMISAFRKKWKLAASQD
ncbi:MAG: hypothetical protein MUP11_11125, partial [Anaerolineales bacterium]|nr:hypothetical protein [Anaerolineales bacterium]